MSKPSSSRWTGSRGACSLARWMLCTSPTWRSRSSTATRKLTRLGSGIERQILELFALETPVASDLRLLTIMLHLALHLERVGDIATNIARIAVVDACAVPGRRRPRPRRRDGKPGTWAPGGSDGGVRRAGSGPGASPPGDGRANRPARPRH